MNLPPMIVIIVSFCLHAALAGCPSVCECKWKNGKETVICLNSNLSHVPLHLELGTQVLDLTGNNISTLRNEEFSNASLLNLQKIYISKCKLKSLQRYAFKNLKNLVELDLSMNLLNAVPSHTFDSISELRELKLSGNPIQTIMDEAFVSIPQLIRLEVSDCKVSEIETKAFVGLERSLEWLKIDNNNLANIEAVSLMRLENLHGLELAGNPWNCSCALRPLRNWMMKSNVPFGIPPSCQNPLRLRGKLWDKLDLDDFACTPEIFPSDVVKQSVEGKNVTLTCLTGGVPEPIVRWTLRNKVISNVSGPSYSSVKKLYVIHLADRSSNLTIFSADLQDAGVYICSAENRAGKAEASVTLAISRKPHEQYISGKLIFLGILIGTLFVIISCMISLVLCTRQKSVKWRTRECARDENYEKIELNHKIIGNSNGGVNQHMEIALVNKRNGEYSVVPGGDTDQELEEDESSTLDIASKSSQWTKDLEHEQKWRSPDHLPEPSELHIPRQVVNVTRDDFPKITTSTSGTFKKIQESPVSATGPNFTMIPRESPEGHGIFVNTSYKSVLPDFPVEPKRKKFPDIVGNNTGYSSKYQFDVGRGANSEGGSVNDLSDLFCTLPRKNKKYKSTDSEAPLLTDSRYVSSGGESYSSQDSYIKKIGDTYKYTTNNRNRVNKMSNSYLNLCKIDRPSTSQEFTATPLLNVSGLENRQYKQGTFSPTSGTPNANSYDYHATQLERFLEEYRNLQKQLTKMKETCDNLRQDTNYLRSVSRTNSSDDMNKSKRTNSIDATCSPNPNENSVDLSNFQSELTKYLLTKSSSPNPYASGTIYQS
ncbi:hypothetical protein HHI36_011229 [Cryptolaemus montrouzieri]|uniref:Ig-like domain-containing protein n=1 Tax=Cryptolaemus montrouzieri TaxID=559131 RepID=A0ABD2ML76_9CUCU